MTFHAQIINGVAVVRTADKEVKAVITPIQDLGYIVEHPDFVDIYPTPLKAVMALAIHTVGK